MPRSTFKADALGGAMPGLTRLAASLMGKDQAYQQGYDSENLNQSRMAQALSQIQMHNAQADKLGAEAEIKRQESAILGKRPDQYEEQAALASGTDLPMVRAIRQSLNTGQAPQMEMAGPTEDGGPLMGDIDPAKASAVRQALQRLAPLVTNTGDFKVDDWAKAQGMYGDQDLRQQVLDGQRTAADVGRAQAAMGAKPLYNSDANGAVLDLFSGNLDTSNPMAGSTIALKGAQAGAQKANAAQSYAAAENSKASAAQTRAQTLEAANGGGAKPPAGYRWSADGRSLEAIPGGPVDPNTKGTPKESLARIQDARDVLDLLDMAKPIVSKATSSYAGRAIDQGLNVFGASTEGADAAAQLQAIEGMLISKMPKMSGPQSDKDVLLYKQMAGRIGDPTVPVSQKQAAMVAIANINRRYLANQPAAAPMAAPMAAPAQPAGLTPGMVMDGHRFKGGNPADPAAWEKVQ